MSFDAGSIEATASIDRTPFQSDLDAMKAAIRDFEARGISVTADVDSDDAWARLDALNHEADKLDGRDVTLDVNVKGADEAAAQIKVLDTEASSAEQSVSRLNKTASEGGASFNPLIDAIVLLGPALVPLAGAAIPLLGGLVGVLGSVALGVYGVSQAMKAGTPDGLAFTAGISTLKGDLNELAGIAASNLLGPFNAAIGEAARLMPQLTDETGRFANIGGSILVSTLDGLVSAFIQLDPLLTMGAQYLLQGAEAFDRWAQSTGGIKSFTDWAVQNFPKVMAEVQDFVQAVVHLAEAFGQTGMASLTALGLLSRAINAIPLPVLEKMVDLATAGYVAWKAYSALDFVSGLFEKMGAAITESNIAIDAQMTAQAALPALIEANTVAWGNYQAAVALAADGNVAAQDSMAALGATAVGASAEMDAAAVAAKGVGFSIAGALGPIGAVVAGVGILITQFHLFGIGASDSTQQTQGLTQALIASKGAIDDNVRAAEAKVLSDNGVLEKARELHLNLGLVTDAALGNQTAMAALNDQMGQLGPVTSNTDARQKLTAALLKAQGATAGSVQTAKDLSEAEKLQTSTANANVDAATAQGDAWQAAVVTAAGAAKQIETTTRAMQAENDAAGLLTAAFKVLNGGTLDVAEAQTALDEATLQATATLAKNHGEVKTGTQASVDDERAIQAQVTALQAHANATATATKSTVAATTEYDTNAAALQTSINKTYGATSQTAQYYQQLLNVGNFHPAPTILDVETGRAAADLGQLLSMLNTFSIPRTANVRVASTVTTGTANAEGSITHYYADGGTENHVAQMAPAGAMRVWAEPETGGEAYIPLADSKRPRSMEILKQTAQAFGATVMANGGALDGVGTVNRSSGMSKDLASQIGSEVASQLKPVLAAQSRREHELALQRGRQGALGGS